MATWSGDTLDVAYPRRVVLVSGAHGVNEFYSVALPPVLPLLVSSLELTYARAGLLVTVYFAMYTLLQLPVGVVADRLEKGRLIAISTAGLAGGFLLASVAHSYAVLVASQVIAGAAGSVYHPAGMSLVSDLESSETEGRAMGVHGLGGIVGTMLAPVIVGGVAVVAGWRTALAASATVGVAYAVVFALGFTHPEGRAASDPAGGPGRSLAEALDDARAAVGRGVRTLFSWWVLGLVLAKVLFGLQFGAVRTFTTSYAFAVLGESASLANLVFFVLLGGGAIASLRVGDLADRVDRGHLLAATFLLAGGFLAATALVPTVPIAFVGWFLLLGAAVYAGLPAMNALVSQFSTEGSSGSLFGLMQTASAVGSATAPALFGAVATRYDVATAFPAVAVVSLLAAVVLFGFAVRVFSGANA